MASTKRSSWRRSRTVKRRWSASGLSAPNVRGTMPLRRRCSAADAAASRLPKGQSRKLVTLGTARGPVAEGGCQPFALDRQCLALARASSGRRRAAVPSVAEIVERLPGRPETLESLDGGRAATA